MERQESTMALFHRLDALSNQYQLGQLAAVEPGGGSDSAYTQAAGVTSICGLGPSGGEYHTNREYVEISSIPRRAKLLAALLYEQEALS
jgi:glutamate carboxypeptidase